MIDLDGDEFINRATNRGCENFNPNLKKLIKNGQINAIPYPEIFERIQNEADYFITTMDYQALYLLSKSPETCQNHCNNYGYIFISKDEIDEKIGIFQNSKNLVYTLISRLLNFKSLVNVNQIIFH